MSIDAQLLHDDDDARLAATDTTRSFIVQAPAGSGKTELLIQRYLGLLSVVEHPEEVLAITFTVKAAAEMQLRVLQALQTASSGVEPQSNHERITFAAAKAALAQDRQRGWQLIANPRRLRIQTLDALNGSIARSQPLSSPAGAAGNAVLADAEMRALYRQAAALTLDQLTDSGPLHDATKCVLLHLDNQVNTYVSHLARMLQTRDQWLPFIGSGLVSPDEENDLRRRVEANLSDAITEQLRRIDELFPRHVAERLVASSRYAAEQLQAAGKVDHAVLALGTLQSLPAAQASAVAEWAAIAELLLTKDGGLRKTVNKLQGFPTGDSGQKQQFLDLLAELREHDDFVQQLNDGRALPAARYSDKQWQVLLALFQLLPLAVTELKRLFSQRGVSDHIEVALGAAQALGSADEPGDVALIFDYQLRHLLVDEMQDTSSAQYRMLEALTGGWVPGDGRTLFCVGDPMQSIYRFRNAEVGQFLLAREAGLGSVPLEPLTLRRNFRSGEVLVDWFNAVFPLVLPAKDDVVQSAVSYTAAVSVESLAGEGKCRVHPIIGNDRAREAEVGCRVIRQTLEDFPDDSIAVLVRSRNQLSRLLTQLRRAAIAYRAVEIDRLTDLPEIIDVLALTRAIVHAGDRVAWLGLLRSPLFGLDWTDLQKLVASAPHATVTELLDDENRLATLSSAGRAQARRLGSVVRDLARGARVATLRERVESGWLSLGGPALVDSDNEVDNIYRFLDVVERLESAGSLDDVAELEDSLDQERVSSNADSRLQIMTMHKAKGLQFDHVLLFGLGHSPRSGDRDVLSWFDLPDASGQERKVMSPVGPRAEVEADPVHKFIQKSEANRYRHEAGRLLYVACTRARKRLHLVGHCNLDHDGEMRMPAKNTLLRLLWPAVRDRFEAAISEQNIESVTDAGDGWLQPQLRRLAEPWQLPAVAEIPGTVIVDTSEADEAEVEYSWVTGDARIAGTLVHRWLQMAADGQLSLDSSDVTQRRPIHERMLREKGLIGERMDPVIDRVEVALEKFQSDPEAAWLLRADGHAELGLTGMHDGRLESVLIDRVCIDESGEHWIVDYKTSSHEGGNLDAFLQAESDRYRPQLRKYATLYEQFADRPVRCALYFPLLQRFVEVDPSRR